MALVINTNISSMNATRQLAESSGKLATAMGRLSSGLRINSAKDDAAGLAIASRMTAQITGLNVAQRNANDGISLAQTAEGAMASISTNLQRVRELAVQSSNATNSADDRAALQKEVNQLTDEIERVATGTKFNGTNLLDGSFTAQKFQVGADKGESITVDKIASMKMDELITGATQKYNYEAGTAVAVTDPEDAATIKVNGVDISIDAETSRNAGNAVKALATAFNTEAQTNSKLTGLTMSDDGKISGTNADKLTIGTGTNVTDPVAGTETKGDLIVDISSADAAENAIAAMDDSLKIVNSARADLGALQNRFESVVSNLATTSENLTASRSRIVDADFATETANLSQGQVLQQAGMAMLAQANQGPQSVLSLLR
ncbi:MAG: flagellin [Comamonadaceae bacterium]|nr:flagellin [Comamonadaceae bacterium]